MIICEIFREKLKMHSFSIQFAFVCNVVCLLIFFRFVLWFWCCFIFGSKWVFQEEIFRSLRLLFLSICYIFVLFSFFLDVIVCVSLLAMCLEYSFTIVDILHFYFNFKLSLSLVSECSRLCVWFVWFLIFLW